MDFRRADVAITSRYSAGCLPCPFAYGTAEHRFLSVHRTLEKIRASEAPLVVISGGEPFEHPHFAQMVHALGKGDAWGKPFRIATGGHRSMAEYLPELKGHVPLFVCPSRSQWEPARDTVDCERSDLIFKAGRFRVNPSCIDRLKPIAP